MSFLVPKPELPSAGAPERQSYEASGPVPVGFGRFRAGLKLFESPFNHSHRDHGDRRPKGNVYSIVAGGIHGPVERLYRVWINGKPIWQLAGNRGSENFSDFSYQWDRRSWRARVYWGTKEQPADPFLCGTAAHNMAPPRNPDGSVRVHPPYAGLFYVIFYELHFDFPGETIAGQSMLPPIEAEVLVRPPNDSSVSSTMLNTRGVNPISVARELLTNPVWGADLPDALVSQAQWSAKAEEFQTGGFNYLTGGEANLSPVWAQNRDLSMALSDLFSYYDGFVRLRNGQLLPDYFPNQEYDPGELTTITRHDCIEEADIDPEGWEETLSEITVTHREVGEFLSDTSLTERSTYNRLVTERGSRTTLNAPHLISSTPARRMAHRALQQRSLPGLRARLKLLRGRARNPDGTLLLPGDLCYLNYEPYALQLLCRVIEREDRGSEVTLLLENERGKFPENYQAVPDPRERPKIDPPGIITNWRLFELPDVLAGQGWPPKVAVLYERPNPSVISAAAYINRTDTFGVTDQRVRDIGMYAVAGSLEAALDEPGESIRFTTATPGEELELFRDFTEAEQANGYVLALIENELVSLGELIGVDPDGERTYHLTRGAFGTSAQAHAAGTGMFLFKREWLPAMTIEHEYLRWESPYNAASATVWVRLQANTGWEVGDPNDPQPITLRSRVPVVTFTDWPDQPQEPFEVLEWNGFTVRGKVYPAESRIQAIYMQLVHLSDPERILHSWASVPESGFEADWEFRVPDGATLGHPGACQVRLWVVDSRQVFIGGGLLNLTVSAAAPAIVAFDAPANNPPVQAIRKNPVVISGTVTAGALPITGVFIQAVRQSDNTEVHSVWAQVDTPQSVPFSIQFTPEEVGDTVYQVRVYVHDTRGTDWAQFQGSVLVSTIDLPAPDIAWLAPTPVPEGPDLQVLFAGQTIRIRISVQGNDEGHPLDVWIWLAYYAENEQPIDGAEQILLQRRIEESAASHGFNGGGRLESIPGAVAVAVNALARNRVHNTTVSFFVWLARLDLEVTHMLDLPDLPTAPTDLVATAVSHEQVDLSWTDNAIDETGYVVQRRIGAGEWTTIHTLPADSVAYSDTTVEAETTYTYRVGAQNTGGVSWSNEDSAATPGAFTPLSITNLGMWLDGADPSTFHDDASGGSPSPVDGFIRRWEDKSGYGRHATRPSGTAPIYRAGSWNGLSAADFTNTAAAMGTSYTLNPPYTFVVVARQMAEHNTRRILNSTTQNRVFSMRRDGSATGVWLGTALVASANLPLVHNANAHVGVVQVGSSSSENAVWVNGSPVPVNNVTPVTWGTLSLGALGAYNEALDGFLMELVVVPRVLSPSEREDLQLYLKDKWDTP